MEDSEYVIPEPEMEPGEILDIMTPKQLPWERFEDEVAAHVKREIADLALGLHESHCRVHQRRAYFSKIRESEIIFDVAIEVLPHPNAETPLLIWIWECKDYPNRTVGVDEVEEFAEKIRQIGAHKGTIATRKGFQSGAEAVAKHYRIGLVVLNKERHCTLLLSREAGLRLTVNLTSSMTIDCSGHRWDDERVSLESILHRELNAICTGNTQPR